MAESTWEVKEDRKLTFDTPVTALSVRVVNGTVNVVGTDEASARLEISQIEGPPLIVTQEGSSLTVAYEDLPWKGWLKWLDRKGWQRGVTVSLAVPSRAKVEIGVVGAGAVISGIQGPTSVQSVNGDATLVRLSGEVRADTVSGNLEAQSVTGPLRYNSVSGDLTVIEGGAGSTVRADSVSGDMLVDLAASGDGSAKPTDVTLATVSGEVAIRLPDPADARVEAETASGVVSNAFDALRVSGQWGSKKITGTLGAGTGTLKASTVSGSIALLRRPPQDHDEGDGGLGSQDGDLHRDPARDADPRQDPTPADASIPSQGSPATDDTPTPSSPSSSSPSDSTGPSGKVL